MWQCDACSYYNDNWDEACAKCGAAKPGQAAAVSPEPATTPDDSTTVDATVVTAPVEAESKAAGDGSLPKADSDVRPPQAVGDGRPPAAAVDRVLRIVIAVIGLAIVATAIFAWQRGLLSGVDGKREAAGASGNQAMVDAGSEEIQVTQADVDLIPAKHRRRFSGFLDQIAEAKNAAANLRPQIDRDGVLAAEDLTVLDALYAAGQQLGESYGQFEQAVADAGDPELATFSATTRQQYEQAMHAVLEALGAFRAADLSEMQRAYLLSDELPAVADKWGHLDTESLHEIWLQALRDRHQLELDLKYVEYYRQIQARLDALIQIHQEFNQALQDAEPYSIRSGTLGAGARAHLDALDSYAGLVERSVMEFEEYLAELEGLEISDRREELIESFESLAQQDHIYCFTEIYTIYVKDQELDHPVYGALKDRFGFVREYWPRLESTYSSIALGYEAEWDRFWRPGAVR